MPINYYAAKFGNDCSALAGAINIDRVRFVLALDVLRSLSLSLSLCMCGWVVCGTYF